ncbi:MAG TPA: hypothetical protein PK071_02610 [Atopobiaceae bacterium]|nr:hypothetical protein [Atopobiaceae bacterium]
MPDTLPSQKILEWRFGIDPMGCEQLLFNEVLIDAFIEQRDMPDVTVRQLQYHEFWRADNNILMNTPHRTGRDHGKPAVRARLFTA